MFRENHLKWIILEEVEKELSVEKLKIKYVLDNVDLDGVNSFYLRGNNILENQTKDADVIVHHNIFTMMQRCLQLVFVLFLCKMVKAACIAPLQ